MDQTRDIDQCFDLEVRSANDEERIIDGIATTSSIALDGMILESRGVEFKLPIPFLLDHDLKKPLGSVVSATVSDSDIKVRMKVIPAGIDEEVDRIYQKIKHGAIRGLSIRWKTIKEEFDKTAKALRITKSRWIELSATSVGVDQLAGITHARSAEADLAALGNQRSTSAGARINPTGASVQPNGKPPMKTLQEQISASEATRSANVARMKELTDTAAASGTTLDEAQEQEYDALETDVRKLDKHITRLRSQETLAVATARPVQQQAVTNEQAGAGARAVSSGVRVSGPDLPKGTGFTRYAIALNFADGDRQRAAEIFQANRKWMDETPEVLTALRAPVAAGTTTDSVWAGPLVQLNTLVSEFVDLVRPKTLIGRIEGFRTVGFNSLIQRQTAGTEAEWVGEGARKPVGRLSFDTIELKPLKLAMIVVLTNELIKYSNPSAEARVRNDLIRGIARRIDRTFVDPSVTASANVRPASIFNGADTAAATGTAIAHVIADVKAAMATFTALEIDEGIVAVTTPTLAIALSLMRTTLDAQAFPGMSPTGGNLLGFPTFVSSAVPSGMVGFFAPEEIFLADEGTGDIRISKEATIIMDDGGSPSATNQVSLFQENKTAILGERAINWIKRHDDSTYYISGANYGG